MFYGVFLISLLSQQVILFVPTWPIEKAVDAICCCRKKKQDPNEAGDVELKPISEVNEKKEVAAIVPEEKKKASWSSAKKVVNQVYKRRACFE
jgi:hypothetical protein